MSDTESDQGYEDEEVDFVEDFETDPAKEASFPLEAILQILDDENDAYSHSFEPLNALVTQLNLVLHARVLDAKDLGIAEFRCLVTKDVIEKLLRLRSSLRIKRTASQKCPVYLIDRVISKLGFLVLFVANAFGGNELQATRSESLKDQIERDSVRAANSWDALPSALTSDHVSPAAKRLIIRLLFGVTVMQGEFDRNPFKTSGVFFLALEAIVREYIVFDGLTGSPIISKDELDCGFFLNLYATIQTAIQKDASNSDDRARCKPYLDSQLLAMIDTILYAADDGSQESPVSQAARVICFGWGDLVPWIWATWADQRVANGDIVITVTLRWLETVECDAACLSHRTCVSALNHLSKNIYASFIALSDAFIHEYQSRTTRELAQITSLLLLVLRQIMEGCDYRLDDRLRPYASKHWQHEWGFSLDILEATFLLLLIARDNYLDLLLSMDKSIVQQSLAELQTDRVAHLSNRLDHVFSEAKDCLGEALISPAHISMIRFALGLLTILCNGGIRGIILRENISSFFMRLYNRLIMGDRCYGCGKMLLGPLITALMAAEKYLSPSRPFASLTDAEEFWRLCLKQPSTNFFSSMALAQYILQRTFPRKLVLLIEALDYFRIIVLKIIREEMYDGHNDIVLLFFPAFCLAMIQLLTQINENSQVARAYFVGSPWTMELCRELGRLMVSPQVSLEASDGCSFMQKMMGSSGALLLQALSNNNGATRAMEVPKTRLLLYQSQIITVIVGYCIGFLADFLGRYAIDWADSRTEKEPSSSFMMYGDKRELDRRKEEGECNNSDPVDGAHRRRSRSASTSSPTARRSPDDSLRIATKRAAAYPNHASGSSPTSLTHKWDVDAWRRGKRRRRDMMSPDIPMNISHQVPEQHDTSYAIGSSAFTFSTSPADFNFFPKPSRPARAARVIHLQGRTAEMQARPIKLSLRGFAPVHFGSSIVVSQKTEKVDRRGRKWGFSSQTTRITPYTTNSDESDDDEEIQIFAGELSMSSESCSPPHGKRALSMDVPYSPGRQAGYHGVPAFSQARPSSPSTSESDGLALPSISEPPLSPSVFSFYSTPSSLPSPVQSQSLGVDSSSTSFSLPPSLSSSFSASLPHQTRCGPLDKAMSEIVLALASGAGGINDYSHLQNLTGFQNMEEGEPGELWH
ncbi:hypothetical protein NP233_g3662 [Leucocoprinus birnbaumii]|uniref:Uncharacterized protein n=1 Tax=Leucocoprinus birnbaumii TaxID=56174 RepID=A0AAD5VWM3_9AGAR|nr:hypothetical protein NP233_g3662 [Leucocoprinus birnbaumii]